MLIESAELGIVHDGKIINLRYYGDKRILIDVCTANGENLAITLVGVYVFAAQNLLEGNIIFDACVRKPLEINDQDIKYVIDLEGKGRDENRTKDKIHSENFSLFIIEPTYGAEIACICAEISLEKTPDRSERASG